MLQQWRDQAGRVIRLPKRRRFKATEIRLETTSYRALIHAKKTKLKALKSQEDHRNEQTNLWNNASYEMGPDQVTGVKHQIAPFWASNRHPKIASYHTFIKGNFFLKIFISPSLSIFPFLFLSKSQPYSLGPISLRKATIDPW